MEKIASFCIDHETMSRGLFLSRQDKAKSDIISTFDIRLKLPNREPVLDNAALHSIEHLGATFLRNHNEWANRTIYFGPMGCRTGFYVIFLGDFKSEHILPIMKEMFEFIASFEGDIPGATKKECGNYLDNNLAMAKWEARKFLSETLSNMKLENFVYA